MKIKDFFKSQTKIEKKEYNTVNATLESGILFISFNVENLSYLQNRECDSEIKKFHKSDVEKIVVDLTGVTYIDSTGIAMFIHIYNHFDQKKIKLINANNENVNTIFKLLNIDRIFFNNGDKYDTQSES